MTVVDG